MKKLNLSIRLHIIELTVLNLNYLTKLKYLSQFDKINKALYINLKHNLFLFISIIDSFDVESIRLAIDLTLGIPDRGQS